MLFRWPLAVRADRAMKHEIMYIEPKSGVAALTAHIGKVQKSKTGKTLRYNDKEFQSLKGHGYKANYYDVETGDAYWISGCRKDGNDGLYKIEIYVDEDIREEYWTDIRNMPERKDQESYTSTGKHQSGGKEPKNKRNNV
jgi:hypothetical protein